MTPGPETRIVRAIIASVSRRPRSWLVKIHGGPFQAAGIPDIIGCIDGRFVALEVKVPGARATKLQELTLSRIAAAGGIAAVVTSVAEAESAVEGSR